MDKQMMSEWAGDIIVNVEELTVLDRPWQYRGEGNANIVIALQDDLRVVRLTKVAVLQGSQNNYAANDSEQLQQRRRVEREVAFANSVFIPLLGVEYVGQVQAVHLTRRHIHELNAILHNLRPVYRLHKELRMPFATAHRDFARIHPYPSTRTDYCVEIKPKQGWWPKHLKHAKLCTYCLNQFLKLGRSKIASRTEYCPLDLFSGSPERMICAILALISNPQNNLRLFRDGILVYGENVGGPDTLHSILSEWILIDQDGNFIEQSHSLISNFVFLLCTALLKPKRTAPFSPLSREFDKLKSNIADVLSRSLIKHPSHHRHTSCSEESHPLPKGCILSRILEIQKMADIEGGVDSLYSQYCRICPVHSSLEEKCEDKKVAIEHDASMSSCCSTSSNDDVFFELDVHSNNSSSEYRHLNLPNRSRNNPKTGDNQGNIATQLEMRILGSEEEDEESSGCGGGGESETSGLSSLSHDEDDEYEDETIHEAEAELLKQQSCPGPHCLSVEKWLDELGPEKLALKDKELADMESYLIAATAKDCSIMITFSPVYGERARERTLSEAEADSISTLYSPTSPSISNYEDSDLILQDLHGTFHRVRIGVADLDPKPVSCIVKHYLRDRDMLADFAAYARQEIPH